jgi:predicted nucleic acid-binding protein
MPAQRDLVINTGPLLALTAAGQLDVLRKLFAKIVVPHEVVQEVEAGGRTLLRPTIAKMRERGIWLSDALEKECLRAAGE